VFSKKTAKTFPSIFSIPRQQNNLKTIGGYTEKTDLILKTSSKNYSSRDIVPLNENNKSKVNLPEKSQKYWCVAEGKVYKEAKPKPGLVPLFFKYFLILGLNY
jgi:hypothetical protein